MEINDNLIYGIIGFIIISLIIIVTFLYLKNWYKIQSKIYEFEKRSFDLIDIDELQILINEVIFFDRENACTKYHKKQFISIIKITKKKIEKLKEINY